MPIEKNSPICYNPSKRRKRGNNMSKMYMVPIENPYSALLYSPKKYISLIKYVIKECLGKDMSSVGNIIVGHFVYEAYKYSAPSKYEIKEIGTDLVYVRLPCWDAYWDICVYLKAEESIDFNTGFRIIIIRPEYTSCHIVYGLEVLFLGDEEPDASLGYIYRVLGS